MGVAYHGPDQSQIASSSIDPLVGGGSCLRWDDTHQHDQMPLSCSHHSQIVAALSIVTMRKPALPELEVKEELYHLDTHQQVIEFSYVEHMQACANDHYFKINLIYWSKMTKIVEK